MKTTLPSNLIRFKPLFTGKPPSLTSKEKDLLVKIIPFLVLIAAIFRLLGARYSPALQSHWLSLQQSFGFVLVFLTLVVFTIPTLFNYQKSGWKLTVCLQCVLLVADLLVGNWLSGFVNALIGFWILFQVKERYS